jgi:hypothetical protein
MSILSKLVTAGCLAVGACGITLIASNPTAFAQPPGKDGKAEKGPKGKEGPGPKGKEGPKHIADLRRTYDILNETAALTRPVGKKKEGPEADGRRFYDAAKKIYRDAVKAADAEEPSARELAIAAHDAARGLKHFVTATIPVEQDLPQPPTGRVSEEPWTVALNKLQRTKDRLGDMGDVQAGREFRDAARKLYSDARAAYEAKDYPKAAELARGAEAWSHVGEHLERAMPSGSVGQVEKAPPPIEGPRGREPEPKLRGKEIPPPPPALGQK